jgi:hypothetical protein
LAHGHGTASLHRDPGRVRVGKHLSGGDVLLATLWSEVELLLTLRLIEPAGTCLYRLTALGDLVVNGSALISRRRSR